MLEGYRVPVNMSMSSRSVQDADSSTSHRCTTSSSVELVGERGTGFRGGSCILYMTGNSEGQQPEGNPCVITLMEKFYFHILFL